MISFILNDQFIQTTAPAGLTVLDFIRKHRHLKGTKTGCREGDCGACTVLVGELQENNDVRYISMTSCLMPLANAQGKHIVSVEGINMEHLSPVQQCILDENGSQCGFCTVGFVMSLTGYCLQSRKPSSQEAISSMDGNICRCTGYKSLERAAEKLAAKLPQNEGSRLNWLVENKFIPAYFSEIPVRLAKLETKGINADGPWQVGGGTDLYVQKHEQMEHAEARWHFNNPELRGITVHGDTCYIGSASTVSNLLESEEMLKRFPGLKTHIKLVSSTPIRNMATLAGNIVNASPIGDFSIFLLALKAGLILKGPEGERDVPLVNFYTGYKQTLLKPGEHIHRIYFDAAPGKFKFNFEKVSKRTHLDIASVNSAFYAEMDESGSMQNVGLSVGGVYAYPLFLKKTSAFLNGKKPDNAVLAEAAVLLQKEIAPISDARGTEEYKRLLARQLLLAHFAVLFPEQVQPEVMLDLESHIA